MDKGINTITLEDTHFAPFFNRTPVSIERGKGVYVWDENGKRYLDFTAGWGVTSIGHAHPVISQALAEQSSKIIHNPDSGLTYSPARANLLSVLQQVLPEGLTRIFFTNSGAEAVDAAIKLARKASGKMNIVSACKSFHGRTIAAVSATGQTAHRDKFRPLVPNHITVRFNDVEALAAVIGDNVAAFIVEPIQGEGGIRIPAEDYLEKISQLCARYGVYLILDEVQTGFFRTGRPFASSNRDIKIDFLTMAKGIAGGFPFGAFAFTEEVAKKLEKGDHGGTYCGNPLGCAVASAVIGYLLDNHVGSNVERIGSYILGRLTAWRSEYPETIADVRGKGLLIALEFRSAEDAKQVKQECFDRGLLLNITQGNVIRIFPALNITRNEAEEGLEILENALEAVQEVHAGLA